MVAAGSGSRLGAKAPKAFVPLGEGTVLSTALESLQNMPSLAYVMLVVPNDRRDQATEIAKRALPAVPTGVVSGGATRQESVASGLAALPPEIETVLVHDAARALTPVAVFQRVVAAVQVNGAGVVPVVPVVDTLRAVGTNGAMGDTVDRSQLRAVQTPQGFPRAVLDRAYAEASADLTDDAALVAAIGVPIFETEGDPMSFKITVPADFERAARLVAERDPRPQTRIGTGIDSHAFSADEHTPLWLAGLQWPGERGLAGHSDGDVVCHAICDALLAAAGLGDIGQVFGTDDPRFAGAHGDVFVQHTVGLLADAGYRVSNVTVQLIGNRPKLAPRRAEAEATLTALLGAPINLSATTTDGMGFTGRGEGIAAIATALLVRR